MAKHKKKIALALLLPTIILNFGFGVPGRCLSSVRSERMSCCNVPMSQSEGMEKNLAAPSCACQLSERQQSDIPLANTAQIARLNSKETEKNFVNISQWIDSSRLDIPLVSKQSYIFFQPKIPLHSKIYDLDCSYLI